MNVYGSSSYGISQLLKLALASLDGSAQDGNHLSGVFSTKYGASSDDDVGTGISGLIDGAMT